MAKTAKTTVFMAKTAKYSQKPLSGQPGPVPRGTPRVRTTPGTPIPRVLPHHRTHTTGTTWPAHVLRYHTGPGQNVENRQIHAHGVLRKPGVSV